MQILHQGEGHYHLGGDDHDHAHGEEHDHDHHHEGGHHDHGHSHSKKEHKHEANINVSAAYCHALSDMIMSIGVIIAATIIYFKPEWRMADPICTFVFSIIVCVTVVPITGKCVHILMEGAPSKVDIPTLIKEIKKCDPDMEMSRLHVWSITNSKVAMSCHIKTKLDTGLVLKEVTTVCTEKFSMRNVTIQIEDGNSEEHKLDNVASPKYLKELLA
jgi:zinc transporter 2